MSLPTENEIKATAAELGLLDADGNYPRDKRTQLAAVAMKMRDVPADEPDEPEPLTTAQAVAQFARELHDVITPPETVGALLLAAVPALIARDGLVLGDRPETTRIYAWGKDAPVREVENRTP